MQIMDGVRKMKVLFLLAALVLILGCSRTPSRPELAKVNENGAAEWKRHDIKGDQYLPAAVHFGIRSTNRIDTPLGEKVAQFGISCGGDPPLEIGVTTLIEAQSGDVKIGFDGASLADEKWDVQPLKLSSGSFDSLRAPEAERGNLLRHLRRAGTFQFEFTPKGGKPQLSSFKLLNINTLLDQEKICKTALDNIH